MRLSQVATVGAMLALALALSACGADGPPVAGKVEAAPARSAPHGSCRAQLHPLLASLGAMRRDLAVGLSYDQYMAEFRSVRAAYRGTPVESLQLGCVVAAGAPAERALNRYVDAANVWGECLATAACATASIEPRLQRKWEQASELLSAARADR
jgi:hypothetical protein